MTSAYSERTFAHHWLHTNASSQVVEIDQVKWLIKAFLEDVKFNPDSPFIKDKELETAVWSYSKNRELGEKTEKLVPRTLGTSGLHYASTLGQGPLCLPVPVYVLG
ncbi:hypothetical protein N7530_008841 [Penicillium desertorum]|uniref:Uncharacterized protein n=1 Tax=Penicillium desertorum TaxID=1303715 RepID=A0A9W9WPY7_9EURO|nr:hypothetical protein N7530_008841 [Penicillium desertorum]